MGTGSGAICWPYYWDIHRFLGTLPLHDESLAEEGGFSQGSPAQGILEGIARGEEQDKPGSEGCSSPLPVVAPEPSGNSASASTPSETGEAASSCEAGLCGSTEEEQKKRNPQPSSSTLMAQLLDEQRQLRLSLERRREKELQLKEQQLKLFKDIAATDEKLVSVLEFLANK
ncbi:hypothetical protein HPB52_003555 [Rhipicephalus sanguineus]|uniref:Uncharacterized protein n=1 Tax=Rhipicephalus sanguineus TaxID=34632 RepID=A0A9D4QH05_RHISA|nr:hypothetical protein HPB52_003555 [Rhipicephalus sanguineus]